MQTATNKQACASYPSVETSASYPAPKTTNPSQEAAARSTVDTAGAYYAPLETITRPNVDTAAAAYYLNRQQQTLRGWACFDNGPIRPLRICGRLAWPVAEIKKLTGVAA